MPPTENYQVMLYVSISNEAHPWNIDDWVRVLKLLMPSVPGFAYDVGYIDNADYEVGA